MGVQIWSSLVWHKRRITPADQVARSDLNLPQKSRSEIRRLCQQTTQGRCLRTPHQLQASVRKQYPNEASQQEESNATTLAFVGATYRRKSKKIRFGEQ
ncbi:hypothetical protein F511_34424 [Dorcoceras hygrometricum]|uniref:Uncharacterized protein n=1 Tax=Dorcoceras hygrometricum TaxID=472368 RepID=A0A2Z7CA40_9LAMI|nr:hypothetical protein F511_34424 [Dorcoceras hygrometricum]